MRILFIILFPSFIFAQTDIPKKSNTIIIESGDPAKVLKMLAKEMIKNNYQLEKDFDLGYVNGTFTQEAKGFRQSDLQMKLKAYEEEGKIYLSGEFSLFKKRNGDFHQFDTISWKGGKMGAWKMTFKKMVALTNGIGDISYLKR